MRLRHPIHVHRMDQAAKSAQVARAAWFAAICEGEPRGRIVALARAAEEAETHLEQLSARLQETEALGGVDAGRTLRLVRSA